MLAVRLAKPSIRTTTAEIADSVLLVIFFGQIHDAFDGLFNRVDDDFLDCFFPTLRVSRDGKYLPAMTEASGAGRFHGVTSERHIGVHRRRGVK